MKLGWFSTGRDEQARQLLEKTHEAMRADRLGAIDIPCVFVNRREGEFPETDRFLQTARSLGIPLVSLSSGEFQPDLRQAALRGPGIGRSDELLAGWRDAYDREVFQRLAAYNIDVIFLAGYMLIMGPRACRENIILNLHPALPGGPKGSWQEVIWQLLRDKRREAGIMVHRVTSELDAGPAITYCRFSIRGTGFDELWEDLGERLTRESIVSIQKEEGEKQPLFRAIRRQQVQCEVPLILETIKLLGTGKINPLMPGKPILVELTGANSGTKEERRR
jgi:phosphoribosylglycinamide formyltransferase-1